MKKLSHLTRTSILLFVLFGVDKVLAILRSIIIANTFNLSANLDSFNAANNLPDFLYALISGGALAIAFIPVLSQTLSMKGREATWGLFSRVANLAFLVTAAISIVIAVFAKPIVQYWITPGFNPDQQRIVAELMRLDLIATLIFSISGLVMAGLQTNKQFLLPALAPILYNLGQIFGALVLVPRYGVYGLAYGVILGSILHLLIQIPGLIKYQFRWTASLEIDPEMIAALKVIGPRLLTMFMIQFTFIIRDRLASYLTSGSISALTYGWMIMQVPETLLGTAIATAMLPTISEFASRGDWSQFRQTIEKALRILIALTLPCAAIIAAGIHPLLRAAFHRFDETGIALLTQTTRVFLLALCGYSIQEVIARAFYARQEPWWPLIGTVIRVTIYVSIGVIAVGYFKNVSASAIAFAELSLTVESIVLFFVLNRKLPERITLGTSLVRGVVAALIGGGTAYSLAVIVPGSAVLTALLGMFVGGLICLPIIWSEIKLFLKL